MNIFQKKDKQNNTYIIINQIKDFIMDNKDIKLLEYEPDYFIETYIDIELSNLFYFEYQLNKIFVINIHIDVMKKKVKLYLIDYLDIDYEFYYTDNNIIMFGDIFFNYLDRLVWLSKKIIYSHNLVKKHFFTDKSVYSTINKIYLQNILKKNIVCLKYAKKILR